MKLSLAFVFFACTAFAQLRPDGATASFQGSLPPKPTADLSPVQQGAIEKRLAEVTTQFQAVKKHERAADADIFLKAVRYALEFHEWYDKKPDDGVKKANALLDEAVKRIDLLKQDKTPWMDGSGQKVLGFYSKIDDSPQPYGVEVPEGLAFGKGKNPVPMWVWLHGRGDTATDLHFVYSRLMAKKPGQFQPKGTIVIHPFGRYCNGWKSAGETDVFEARDDATERFNIDQDRIALAGFSMGGAGAWHIGAHFADQWACVHTGAGFVDVKRYQKVTPEKLPPWYEQVLWGVYDVPDYALNFKNVPLISYSGENDSQRDGAEYMTEVFAKYGMSRPHLIGPGMGHKYHPDSLKEVQAWMEKAVEKGRDIFPDKVTLQTRSPLYGAMKWIYARALIETWKEARVDAEVRTDKTIQIKTSNVAFLQIYPPPQSRADGRVKIEIDGQLIELKNMKNYSTFRTFRDVKPDDVVFREKCSVLLDKQKGTWAVTAGQYGVWRHIKSHINSGLMDDPLKSWIGVILPSGKSEFPLVDAWVEVESQRFIKRWKSLMRGDPPVYRSSDEHIPGFAKPSGDRCWILWGVPSTNRFIRECNPDLPISWKGTEIVSKQFKYDAATHVPVMWARSGGSLNYQVILNSGLTFREAHDKTNSLQNPKLPDWAILDITQSPNAESAGKVVAADFFDEHWQVIPRVVSPESREIPK